MNKCIIIGNLTKDVELTKTANDVSVAKFTVAVSRRFANANGERATDFLNCVAWRNQADNLAKYCKKGDKVAVVGSVQTRVYEATDGTKRYITEVMADEIEYIITKRNDENTGNSDRFDRLHEYEGELPF